jgi:hypothetical protein
MKISQSLLKGLLDLRNFKECGLVFKAKYLDNRYELFPPSDTQNLGAWFEYKATGSIPKNGEIPQPEYMKRGKDESGNPQLTAEYRLMQEQVNNYNKMIDYYNLELISAGEDIKADYPNDFGIDVILTGTIDIRAKANKTITANYQNSKVLVAEQGQEIIIDLKTTGLLDDKWNDFGWEINNLSNKVKLVTQPVHYKYIEYLNKGIDIPFVFMLFSTRNPNDARIIDFKVDETSFEEHRTFIDNGISNLLYFQKHGYKPLPSMEKCSSCPLNSDCQFKAEVSPISVFYFANQI